MAASYGAAGYWLNFYASIVPLSTNSDLSGYRQLGVDPISSRTENAFEALSREL